MEKTQDLVNRDAAALSDIMKLRFYPLAVESGQGAVLKGINGVEYLDFSAGWGVANTGYNHPKIVETVTNEVNKLSFLCTISAINEESVQLGEELISLMPGAFPKKVWYGHSGSDANEFISKIVPLASGRPKLLTFVGSYHGQTMGAYGMSGHPAQSHFTAGGNVVKIPYPYCYRCPYLKEPDSCGLFCADYLEDYILKFICAPNQIGAVVAESVQCDGGDVVPPDAYFRRLREICDKHGIWLIFDEVKVGFGRTGRFFGFEHWDIVPDAVIMGKPMGGGQSLSGVVGRTEIMDAGVGLHLFTMAGSPLACASSLASIDIIKNEKLTGNAKAVGDHMLEGLNKLKDKHETIGDVRGKGLVMGIELVKDRKTKEPAPELTAMAIYRSYELGLLYYSVGIFSNVLELTPPLIITKEQADRAIDIIDQSIGDAVDGKVAKEKLAEYAGWGL